MTFKENTKNTILKLANALSQGTFDETQISFPGMVIFFSKLSDHYLSSHWDNTAHNYLSKIGKSIEKYHMNDISLNTGLTGLCYTVGIASKHGSRYTSLLSNLNSILLDVFTAKTITPIRNDILNNRPSDFSLLNIFQGISGTGFYCLNNLSNNLLRKLALEITELLIARCKSLMISHQTMQERYSSDGFVLNYANGVAGVLSYLSWSYLKDILRKDLRDTIQSLVECIIDRSIDKQGLTSWPLSLAQDISITNKSLETIDVSWLHGSAGIIRSLYVAGQALDDLSLQNYATDVFKENLFASKNSNPNLINELGGLMAVTKKMALDTEDPYIEKMSELYYQEVSRSVESKITSCSVSHSESSSSKKLGLLDGIVGLGILLLEMQDERNSWQIPFII